MTPRAWKVLSMKTENIYFSCEKYPVFFRFEICFAFIERAHKKGVKTILYHTFGEAIFLLKKCLLHFHRLIRWFLILFFPVWLFSIWDIHLTGTIFHCQFTQTMINTIKYTPVPIRPNTKLTNWRKLLKNMLTRKSFRYRVKSFSLRQDAL